MNTYYCVATTVFNSGKTIMNEKDNMLIKRAWEISCYNWSEIDSFIDQAESQEAKEKLRVIRNIKYHTEEYISGLN